MFVPVHTTCEHQTGMQAQMSLDATLLSRNCTDVCKRWPSLLMWSIRWRHVESIKKSFPLSLSLFSIYSCFPSPPFLSLSLSLPLSFSFLLLSSQDSAEWSKNEREEAGRKAWTGGLLSSSTSCLYGAVSQCSPPTRNQLQQTNMSPRNLTGLSQTGGLSTTPGATCPLWKDTVKDLQPDIKYTGESWAKLALASFTEHFGAGVMLWPGPCGVEACLGRDCCILARYLLINLFFYLFICLFYYDVQGIINE